MARKLGVSQGEIARFLAGKSMPIEMGSNVKLGESHIRALYDAFPQADGARPISGSSEQVTSVKNPEETRDSSTEPEVSSFSTDGTAAALRENVVSGDDIGPVSSVHHDATPDTPPATPDPQGLERPSGVPALSHSSEENPTVPLSADESLEVIRAPKVELAGLKVLGKIDLPAPRKKDATSAADSAAGEKADDVVSEKKMDGGNTPVTSNVVNDPNGPSPLSRPEGRTEEGTRRERGDNRGRDGDRRPPRKPRGDQRSNKNPIAIQRELEMQKEIERRKEKAAKEKERRTQNYNKRVKHSPPTKAARRIEEPVEVMDASSFEKEPTTWVGKLLRWFGI